jgi:hypothetical protein
MRADEVVVLAVFEQEKDLLRITIKIIKPRRSGNQDVRIRFMALV